jgi:hypothetical protein
LPEAINALLEQVGLDLSHAEHLQHEVYGGQCQRIGIARALPNHPHQRAPERAPVSATPRIGARRMPALILLNGEPPSLISPVLGLRRPHTLQLRHRGLLRGRVPPLTQTNHDHGVACNRLVDLR